MMTDPTDCCWRIASALDNEDLVDAIDAMNELIAWKKRGGFRPDRRGLKALVGVAAYVLRVDWLPDSFRRDLADMLEWAV
jgi:hypothetical protein